MRRAKRSENQAEDGSSRSTPEPRSELYYATLHESYNLGPSTVPLTPSQKAACLAVLRCHPQWSPE